MDPQFRLCVKTLAILFHSVKWADTQYEIFEFVREHDLLEQFKRELYAIDPEYAHRGWWVHQSYIIPLT